MRLCSTVIFTDKLTEVRAFYEKYFIHWPQDVSAPRAFSIMVFAESQVMWLDAANTVPTQNAMIRISIPHPEIEYAQLTEKGVACEPLTLADWGPVHGKTVRYFTVTDPSGTRLLFFEDFYGEDRQLMLTGAGVGTREVQQQSATAE